MDETRVVLVYQAGIANVFRVSSFNMADYGRDAIRLLQGSFEECEAFARGMAAAGVIVRSVHCNMAGDITAQRWDADLTNAPFRDAMHPIHRN